MKKGFTLIELIVSFALITVISVSLFKTVLSVQQRQSQNIAINKFKAFQLLLNTEIENDFLKEEIESVDECGTNCYDIEYKNKGVKRLSIDIIDNVITYGSFREHLPDNYKLIDNMTIKKYESTTEGINSYIFLNIPIKSSLEPSLDSLKYMHTYDSTKEDINGNGTEPSGFGYSDLERAVLLKMYPVGSIYTSTSNVNPGTILGGTWSSYGNGRILVGVDSNDADFIAAGRTGGEKIHTLTVSEIPSHTHNIKHWIFNASTPGIGPKYGLPYDSDTGELRSSSTSGQVMHYAENTGGGNAHNNLQPYITVYRFRRTN